MVEKYESATKQSSLGITPMDRVNNDEVCESFGMSEKAVSVNCGVVEWVKSSTLLYAQMVWTWQKNA